MISISEIATKTIEIIQKVFGESGSSTIPLCISVVSDEGFELFSTENCSSEVDSINVLGIIAFEELKKSLANRTDKNIDILIFRTQHEECFVKPVAPNIYMIAVMQSPGKIGHVLPLLDGLGQQVQHAIKMVQGGGRQ